MDYAIALVVFALAVALFVLGPLSAARERESGDDVRRETLEAAKEAKYREIREAELDHRMGKISDGDHAATDRELRGQAIEILRRLDELEPGGEPRARR